MREISNLEVVRVLNNTIQELHYSLEAEGVCDHSVGICICGLKHIIDEAENLAVELYGFDLEYNDKKDSFVLRNS